MRDGLSSRPPNQGRACLSMRPRARASGISPHAHVAPISRLTTLRGISWCSEARPKDSARLSLPRGSTPPIGFRSSSPAFAASISPTRFRLCCTKRCAGSVALANLRIRRGRNRGAGFGADVAAKNRGCTEQQDPEREKDEQVIDQVKFLRLTHFELGVLNGYFSYRAHRTSSLVQTSLANS